MTDPATLDVAVAPSPVLPPTEVLAAIADGVGKAEFLARIDATRDAAHARLLDTYRDPYRAKLVYLKTTNFLISRYHYARSDARLASRPLSLMVDPSNSCQLQCPGCIHSANEKFTGGVVWPPGLMKFEAFEGLLREYGPFAASTVLYNYGEPLLHKRLPDFVDLAHEYGMTASLSTNLSLRFDVEAFVRSQPDTVILSIDGIRQETYERFRKRGRLDVVLDNVRRIVEAKRRLGLRRPILMWRFFPFEHNVHEVDEAIALAEEIGVDQMIIGEPFDVSIDDPTVRKTHCDKQGRYVFIPESETWRRPEEISAALVEHDEVHALFEAGWLASTPQSVLDEPAHARAGGCNWLHSNLTVDATGRLMPCCIASGKRRDLVYGDLGDGGNGFDSPRFALSRLAFADADAYEREREQSGLAAPYCASCKQQPGMTYGPGAAIHDIAALDPAKVTLDLADPTWWELSQVRP